MTIHKEGYATLIIVFIILVIVNVILSFLLKLPAKGNIAIYAVSILLFLFFLQFFRHPARTIIKNENQIISPADGKIVVIEEVIESEYLKDKRKQVSIFMRTTDVHCNRYPISGELEYVKYHPGKYLMAFHPKSSSENERTSLAIRHEDGWNLMIRQIAGFLARRIVYYGKQGEKVEQGEELGFIKFGSRADLYLPLDFDINVKMGQMVKGGLTVIASKK